MTGGEDLRVASEIGNEALNPGAQLVHQTYLAKVFEVILVPVKLVAAEALVCLNSRLDVSSFLMLRG